MKQLIMKYNFKLLGKISIFCAILLSSFLATQIQAQVYIEQSGADFSELDVTDYDKELILTTTTNVITKYVENANFLSATGQFSEEKYAEFLGLFTGGAKVYNDIAEKDGGNIDYAVYADNIYQYMQGTGVKFELSDIYLESVKYDSSGFYLVTLTMEKLMLNGLNDNNITVNYNNGKPYPLTMKIEMPDYDIEQGSILSILGEAKKVRLEREPMVSFDLTAHLGTLFKKNNTSYAGFGADKVYPTTYRAFGIESLYKTNINESKSLWFLIGLQANYNQYSIALNEFSARSIIGDSLNVQIGGKSYVENDEILVTKKEEASTLWTINKGDDFVERLNVISLEVPIGVGFNLASSYNYDFFMDVAVVPYYSVSSSGRFEGEDIEYFVIPTDSVNFPKPLVDYVIERKLDQYTITQNKFDKPTTASNHFSMSAMISPVFHYKFSYKMAFEIGANIKYHFLPNFKSGHLTGKKDQSFVNYLSDQETVYTSTLQHFHEKINLLSYGLKAGIIIRL